VKFSVIVPAYQAAAVLPNCLDALQCQTIDRSQYEIIVVDDGSTDGTADAAAQALRAFPPGKSFEPNMAARPMRAIWGPVGTGRAAVVHRCRLRACPGLD